MNNLNSREVSRQVKKHIIEAVTYDGLTPKEGLKQLAHQLEVNAKTANRPYSTIDQKTMQYTLQGVYMGFYFTNYDLLKFLQGLNLNKQYDRYINPDNRFFDSDNMWELYSNLIFREFNKLIKKSAKQLEEYL